MAEVEWRQGSCDAARLLRELSEESLVLARHGTLTAAAAARRAVCTAAQGAPTATRPSLARPVAAPSTVSDALAPLVARAPRAAPSRISLSPLRRCPQPAAQRSELFGVYGQLAGR